MLSCHSQPPVCASGSPSVGVCSRWRPLVIATVCVLVCTVKEPLKPHKISNAYAFVSTQQWLQRDSPTLVLVSWVHIDI